MKMVFFILWSISVVAWLVFLIKTLQNHDSENLKKMIIAAFLVNIFNLFHSTLN